MPHFPLSSPSFTWLCSLHPQKDLSLWWSCCPHWQETPLQKIHMINPWPPSKSFPSNLVANLILQHSSLFISLHLSPSHSFSFIFALLICPLILPARATSSGLPTRLRKCELSTASFTSSSVVLPRRAACLAVAGVRMKPGQTAEREWVNDRGK